MRHTPLSPLAALLLAQLLCAPAAATEPTVHEVRAAALRYAGLDGRADRWSARSRWRHLLPEVSLSAGQIDQREDNVRFDEWLTRDADEMLLYDAAKNQNDNRHRFRTDYSIRASIDLSGLVFDTHEISASREARARHSARLEVVELVHAAYFERLTAFDRLRATPSGDPAHPGCARRIAELEAQIDALTGGWYATQLRGSQ